MNMKQVESSNIESVGYDRQTKVMAVKFKGGDTYHYHGVPDHVHDNLHEAESIGSYMHKHVKGKFVHKRQ